ncbi:unnamed protein product [Paramecium pentaurelia]|uniref:WD40-repeat-containing domain n=1 Tax=Paramecium pentaurelia TaxID=43138 RepID=A0A8S1UIM1_9CILI|nr:unnamed protein product [Paramecium pentaurelia]
MSFIAPRLNCQNHQKCSISLINLTTGLPEEKRLYCHRCNLQLQQNLHSIEGIFEFAVSVQQSQNEQNGILKQDKELFAFVKNQLNQIQAYYNQLELEHQQLYELIIQNQAIKANDSIEVCLQKKQQCDKKELIKMAEQVSYLIKQNSEELVLQENNSIQYFSKLEQLRGKINKLQDQLKLVNIDQVQQDLKNTQIIYPKFDNLLQIKEQQIVEGDRFMKIAEAQLEQSKIYDIKFNKENNLFVVGSSKLKNNNCYVQIWKYENNQISKIQDLENCHSGDVKSICFSTWDDSFFTGSQDNTIIYWKLEPQEWKKSQVLDGQSSGIIGLQLNNKGNVLAAVSNQIHLWKREFYKWEKAQVLNQSKKQFLCVSFNNDDSYLAAGSSDCQIYVYQYQNSQWKLKNTIIDQSQEVNFITFIQDLNLIAILKDNNMNSYIYSPNDSYDEKCVSILTSFQVGYSKKGKVLAVSSGRSKETTIYQIEQKEGIKKIQQIQVKSDQVYSSNDGKVIALIANQKLEFYSDKNIQY